MSLFKHCMNFLFADPVISKPEQIHPIAVPENKTGTGASSTPDTKPESGHTERKQVIIQPITPGEPMLESDEQWCRHNDVQEGISTQNKYVTASGEVVDASEIKAECFCCQRYESDLVRSIASSRALCRVCRKEITLSDGQTGFVSADEYQKIADEFDAWEAYDNNVKVPRR